MLLEESTTVDVDEALDDIEVAILPVGSTEQHGPALPLCTDSTLAETVARKLTDRDDSIVLPTVPVGVSSHHRQFHGTLWVSEKTFKQYISEVLQSISHHSVEKAVLVNGHGGNESAIKSVAQDLYQEETIFTVPWSWWEGVGDVPVEQMGEDVSIPGHAGGCETAMMLRTVVDLVREEHLEEAATDQGSGSRFQHQDFRGFDSIDFTDNGVLCDPRLGSADIGETLINASFESLREIVTWLSELPAEKLRPCRHK